MAYKTGTITRVNTVAKPSPAMMVMDMLTLVIIPGADHSMRIAPADLDDDTRFREKFDYNYDHPFSEYFMHSLIGWTLDQFRAINDSRF